MDAVDQSLLFDDGLPGKEHYDVDGEVGHGRFSEVYKAREKATGRSVALKHMELSEPGQLPKHVQRELQALETIRHPNVVSLLTSHQKGFGVSLVLEYCITDLNKLLRLLEGAPLEPALAKAAMQQLLHALHACHTAGFMHRDVSPSNLLVAQGSGLLKLSDFGQARHPLDTSPAAANSVLSPIVGTRWYKAPELLFGSCGYSPAVDLWSAGCVFAELLTGQPLFPGSSDIDQYCRISKVLGSIDESVWPGVKELPDWGKLIFPASQGKGWAEVLPGASPATLELVAGLLQYNPEHRLSAEGALQAAYFREGPAPAPPEALAAMAERLLGASKQQDQQELQSVAAFLSSAGGTQRSELPMPAGVQLPPGWPVLRAPGPAGGWGGH